MPATNDAWGGAELTVTVSGVDVSCDIVEVVVDRSKNRLWDPPDAGTCQVTLNLGLGGQPAARGPVGDQVRVRWDYGSTGRYLFTGTVQRRRLDHNPLRDLLVLDCVDEFDQLGRLNLRAALSDVGVGAGEDVDARLARWLDAAGSTSDRALGDSDMTCPATLLDGNILRQLQVTALADGGDFFIAGDGTVTFLPWRWRDDDTTPAAVFSDRKLHEWVPYSAVDYHDDLDEVQNHVTGTRREDPDDQTPQTATNPASITVYGERGDALDDLELETDGQVATRVTSVVSVAAYPNPRFDGIVVQPAFTPGRSWPRMLPVTFGSLVAANRVWADGTQASLYGHVIGEKWLITPEDVTVTFRCSGTGTWDVDRPPRPPVALERCPDGSLRIPAGYPCDDISDVIIKDADGNVVATYPPGSLCECGIVFPPDDGVEICLDNGSGTLVCVPIDDDRIDAILWVDAFEPVGPMVERITGEELAGGPGYDHVEINVIDPGDYDAIWASSAGGLVAAGDSPVVDAASFSGGWTVRFWLWVPADLPPDDTARYLLSVGESVQIVMTTEYDPPIPYAEAWNVEVRVWDGDDVLHLSGPMYTPVGVDTETWHLVQIQWDPTIPELQCMVDGALTASLPWAAPDFEPRTPTGLYAVEVDGDFGVGELLAWARALVTEPVVPDPFRYWKFDEASGSFVDEIAGDTISAASGTLTYQQTSLRADAADFAAKLNGALIRSTVGVTRPAGFTVVVLLRGVAFSSFGQFLAVGVMTPPSTTNHAGTTFQLNDSVSSGVASFLVNVDGANAPNGYWLMPYFADTWALCLRVEYDATNVNFAVSWRSVGGRWHDFPDVAQAHGVLPSTIAPYVNTNYTDLRVDELRYFADALDDDERELVVAELLGAEGTLDYDTEVLADAPSHYWLPHGTTGTSVPDASGNSRNGTWVGTLGSVSGLAGGPVWEPGYTATAKQFASNSRYFTRADEASLSPQVGASGQITLECWVWLISLPAGGTLAELMAKVSGSNHEYQLYIAADGTIGGACMDLSGNLILHATSPAGYVNPGRWIHIAYTYNRAVPRSYLYRDGAVVATSTTTGGLTSSNGTANFGCGFRSDQPTWGVNGTIERPAIYPTELTAARMIVHAKALR